ncbi:MAG: septation protein A [Burkholderiaceae bacterium]|jgi:intracellular septation protein|nr:septation protein A [Burkholderiaceae bacterium]
MKLLFDLFPVILFFAVYKLGGSHPQEAAGLASTWLGGLVAGGGVTEAQAPILLATAVAILASIAQVGWLLARGRRIEPMLWVSLGVIVVFGGATIWLNDETFIKWKPSILYLLFAGALAAGRLFFRRNFVRALLGGQIELPDPVWEKLLWVWTSFFTLLAAANLYVAYSFSTDTWVNFKLFGLMGLTLAFVVGIGIWLSQHIREAPDA